MKKKTASQFEYDGLGFPILLLNFPLIEVRGIVVPDLDYNVFQQEVLRALSQKPMPLCGNEVRFIRQYMQMTYTEFANRFGVTHAAVIHWEKSKNNFAKVEPSMELCIRLCILDILRAKDKFFRETFRNFDYTGIKSQKIRNSKPLTLDSNCLC